MNPLCRADRGEAMRGKSRPRDLPVGELENRETAALALEKKAHDVLAAPRGANKFLSLRTSIPKAVFCRLDKLLMSCKIIIICRLYPVCEVGNPAGITTNGARITKKGWQLLAGCHTFEFCP